MRHFKSTIKDSWPDALPHAQAFPFDREYPVSSKKSVIKTQRSPDIILRFAAVILIIFMTTILGQIWGDPRFSNVQMDVPRIQQSIPLIREILYPEPLTGMDKS